MYKRTPEIIYGTAWKKERTAEFVETALSLGFRAIDTANQAKHYQEALVGDAVYRSGIPRKEIWLQTKFTSIGGQDHRLPYDPKANLGDQVRQSFASSLKHLRTDFIDSYLLHGPLTHPELGVPDFEIWAAMEELHSSGCVASIGISNVNARQLSQLIGWAEIKPSIVQNRCLAENGLDLEVREVCAAADISYQGFWLLTGNPQLLENEVVRSIARNLGVTPQQLMYSFYSKSGIVPLSGTTNGQHIKEALEAMDLILSPEIFNEILNVCGP
jgi:diketogulonate reductase-like aldo/keto reductase